MTTAPRLNRDALEEILGRQYGVISREQALGAGLTRHALRHRLQARGRWQVIVPGIYLTVTGTPTIGQREMAALLHGGPGSVITGPAALRCHRIRCAATEIIDILVPALRKRHDAAFIRLHRTSRMPGKVWRNGLLLYAMPARAVADTVRDLADLADVTAVVADAVQRKHCDVPELRAELAGGPNIGSSLFREALSGVADGIRSASERDMRALLMKSGLPMPLFNAKVYDGEAFVAQPDAWWPEAGLAVEVDSREWHTSPQDHRRTLERGARMTAHGIIVLRFTPGQIRSDPKTVLARIRSALEHGRNRPPLNLRTVPLSQARPA
ncbi:MAG: hypothetical protein JO242_27350 [Streptosporangiaceae bacterium]|nr:hypothetical protein [Streptosporangiaceae bacterium]